MEIYRQAEFPDNSHFLIVDKRIHGCKSRERKCKLMAKGKDVTIKDCLEIMRKFEAVEVTMKKLEDVGDADVDASYARDLTKKSQRNGFKKKQVKPNVHQNSQKPDEKSCLWCQGDVHLREKCPAKDATCNFCSKQGHFERACLKKKGQGKGSKHQHADSSEYDDEFDLNAVSVHALHNHESREVYASVVFHLKGNAKSTLKGKVDTGAMVRCIPMSILPQIGLSMKDHKPSEAVIRGM